MDRAKARVLSVRCPATVPSTVTQLMLKQGAHDHQAVKTRARPGSAGEAGGRPEQQPGRHEGVGGQVADVGQRRERVETAGHQLVVRPQAFAQHVRPAPGGQQRP
jgi:hypothetical protein